MTAAAVETREGGHRGGWWWCCSCCWQPSAQRQHQPASGPRNAINTNPGRACFRSAPAAGAGEQVKKWQERCRAAGLGSGACSPQHTCPEPLLSVTTVSHVAHQLAQHAQRLRRGGCQGRACPCPQGPDRCAVRLAPHPPSRCTQPTPPVGSCSGIAPNSDRLFIAPAVLLEFPTSPHPIPPRRTHKHECTPPALRPRVPLHRTPHLVCPLRRVALAH